MENATWLEETLQDGRRAAWLISEPIKSDQLISLVWIPVFEASIRKQVIYFQ